jgi:hypothetical protein
MATPDENREQGVDFGPLADELESQEYPTSKAELLEKLGDREIDLESGSQTLQDALGPLGETTFESADDVTQSVLNMVDSEAVGRENYTDRGGEASIQDQSEESM